MHSTLAVLLALLSLSASQYPAPPPDPCFRRNDSLPSCPYGGQCTPTANYTCQRACVNYQYFDNRFWCNIACGYAVTTLTGKRAVNPMLCIQPTNRNGLTCTSGWACYRKFGTMPPLFRSQGPVCSPDYPACDYAGAENATETLTNGTSNVCSAGRTCVLDPRANMAKPLKIDDLGGICVPRRKSCVGADVHECGEKEHCVSEARCRGRIDAECKGVCVTILGPMWGSVNGTTLARRALDRFC